MVNKAIRDLAVYGVEKNLITKTDVPFVVNRLLEVMVLDHYQAPLTEEIETDLEKILKVLLDDVCKRGVITDSIVYRDLFDTKLMGVLTPFPREVVATFQQLHIKDPQKATDWYYNFSCDTDYIRRYRMVRDMRWKTNTIYGDLDITINLSKPEKDPKAIAAAKNAPQSSYPKCMLCKENEGYAGRVNHPARQNHRVIPLKIAGNDWFFQYSPYVYYNEHCIVFHGKHQPMKIDRNAFEKMFDFIDYLPHYFVGSNADLPIVGGSILSHDHFQGGRYTFAMEKANVEQKYYWKTFADVNIGIVKWPLSVIRMTHEDKNRLTDAAESILRCWRNYTDKDAFIFAQTDGQPHNTITPIARKHNDLYELDLVLRNNITTKEHPLGVYHPHSHLHHIKKENIGLIEVMGLAVLPARLKEEMELLKKAILSGEDLDKNEKIVNHVQWAKTFLKKYDTITKENLDSIIQKEIGIVFAEVLECAGVYKQNDAGRQAFDRFMNCFGAVKV